MAGAADGNKFGKPLNDSQNNSLKKVHKIAECGEGVGNGEWEWGVFPHSPLPIPHYFNFLVRLLSSSETATRSWPIESRSRTVTVLSSSDWKSTVTQNGVPISSWRR